MLYPHPTFMYQHIKIKYEVLIREAMLARPLAQRQESWTWGKLNRLNMTNKNAFKARIIHPMVYQIRVDGHLGQQWTKWFGDLNISLEENGETVLTGPVIDQAALHGLLRKVRDLGMPLLSVHCLR